jgi:hypothetical protein
LSGGSAATTTRRSKTEASNTTFVHTSCAVCVGVLEVAAAFYVRLAATGSNSNGLHHSLFSHPNSRAVWWI